MVASAKHEETVRPALAGRAVGAKVRCEVCARRCLLETGASGWCGTRENAGGRLNTTTYGVVSALGADPIEKKPFYHFFPGAKVLTAGSLSCNFHCPWCQNHEISAGADSREWSYVDPRGFAGTARALNCQGVALSYNEPALSLEWAVDVFPRARQAGLHAVLVTNGYLTVEAFELLVGAGLEAVNVDIKGDADTVHRWCGEADIEEVWRTCRQARRAGVHLEIATPFIPGVNDDEAQMREIARRIVDSLGAETPWHVTAYRPAGKFFAPAARPESVRRTLALGCAEGLRFVYPGNLPAAEDDDGTRCLSCGNLLIQRGADRVATPGLRAGCCRRCGVRLAGCFPV